MKLKMKLSKTAVALILNAGLFCAMPLAVNAQPVVATAVAVGPGAALAVQTTKMSATVVGIDATNRIVTLQGSGGRVFDVGVSSKVKNFAQIKLGDVVNAEYTRSLSLDLKKHSTAPSIATEVQTSAAAPKGAMPAGETGRQINAVADVVAVDAKTQMVTLRGPLGRLVELNIQDPAQLKHIKKGDKVDVVYTESLLIAVEPAPKAAAK